MNLFVKRSVKMWRIAILLGSVSALKNQHPILPAARARIRSSVTVPIGSRCENRVPAYLVMENTALLTGNNLKYRKVSQADCMTICSDNLDFSNQNILCAGFTYDFRSRTCYIHRNKAKPTGIMPVVAAPKRRYYEKFCLPEDAPIECGERAFFRAQQSILVGFAVNVTIENTLEDCIAACVHQKDYCKSSMYFYDEGECIMNTESADTHPHVFATEPHDRVVYFENGCYLNNQIRGQDTRVIEKVDASDEIEKGAEDNQQVHNEVVQERVDDVWQHRNPTENIVNNTDATPAIPEPSRPKNKVHKKIMKTKILNDQVVVSAVAAAVNSFVPKKSESNADYSTRVDNLTTKPHVTEWEQWSICDRSVEGRRVRRRKCLPQNAICAESLTEVEWCQSPAVQPQQLQVESQNTASVISNNLQGNVQIQPQTTQEAQSGFGQWDHDCRPLNPPQPCQNGFKLGFQSRQCHSSPFQCLGSFFRYCFMPC